MGPVMFRRLRDDEPTPFDRPGISLWTSPGETAPQPVPEPARDGPQTVWQSQPGSGAETPTGPPAG